MKVATFVFALLLAASLSFAQTGGDKAPKGKTDVPTESSKKGGKGEKKGHKGGKKSVKKGAASTGAGGSTPK